MGLPGRPVASPAFSRLCLPARSRPAAGMQQPPAGGPRTFALVGRAILRGVLARNLPTQGVRLPLLLICTHPRTRRQGEPAAAGQRGRLPGCCGVHVACAGLSAAGSLPAGGGGGSPASQAPAEPWSAPLALAPPMLWVRLPPSASDGADACSASGAPSDEPAPTLLLMACGADRTFDLPVAPGW